jgi:hypothetical protein
MLGRTEFRKGNALAPLNDFFGIPKSNRSHKKPTQENMEVAASAMNKFLNGPLCCTLPFTKNCESPTGDVVLWVKQNVSSPTAAQTKNCKMASESPTENSDHATP